MCDSLQHFKPFMILVGPRRLSPSVASKNDCKTATLHRYR